MGCNVRHLFLLRLFGVSQSKPWQSRAEVFQDMSPVIVAPRDPARSIEIEWDVRSDEGANQALCICSIRLSQIAEAASKLS